MDYLGALSIHGFQGQAAGKRKVRVRDTFDESYFLLMELAAQEPTIQSCFKIIQSTCLAQGLSAKISGKPTSKDFQKHLDKHYILFCEHAIRIMFVCGFVPWRLRRLSTGDPVPEVIPLGMFTWSVESLAERMGSEQSGVEAGRRNFEKQVEYFSSKRYKPYHVQEGSQHLGSMYKRQQRALQRQIAPEDDEATKMLRYRIHFTQNCNVLEDEVEIYEYNQPNKDVMQNSTMFKTIASPMAHILNDYRNMRRAMIQREYADTWNTQARMICSYSSTKNMYNVSEGNPITNDWVAPQNRLGLTTDTNLPTEIEQNAYVRDAVTETIVSSKSEHHKPTIYTLPKNTKLEPVHNLTPVQDVKEMQVKIAKDITSIMGIPYELVAGGYSDKEGKKKAMENTRIFTTNMMNMCKHLEYLMADVYVATYGGSHNDVKFILRPTPRIEIGSVEEIVMLLESGVVSTDDAMQVSKMLLGVDLKQFNGKTKNTPIPGMQKPFITPSQRKDPKK